MHLASFTLFWALLSLATAFSSGVDGIDLRSSIANKESIAIIELYNLSGLVEKGSQNCHREDISRVKPSLHVHSYGDAQVPHVEAGCRTDSIKYGGKKLTEISLGNSGCPGNGQWAACFEGQDSNVVRLMRKNTKNEGDEGKVKFQICTKPGEDIWLWRCSAGVCNFMKLGFECDGIWRWQ
ncbi:hypothetical protein L211DRAFT_865577 [Terfezia boudieri ATCC MYA-4762]|uniref:Uncharacterized protein n=1 Tax=Terfezia boudieri ATCC MYA-4762 TaxID=1051890 RepID=A0A3N4M098_9PEZI|nr:hypothetical protein L211DRAFT_865577 [Terfezia boudieri ATCC MYA-4762]